MGDRSVNLFRSLSLVQKVKFVLQRPFELTKDLQREPLRASFKQSRIDGRRQQGTDRVVVYRQKVLKLLAERLEIRNVPEERRHHVGPLDLDGNDAAVEQRSFVHLWRQSTRIE